MASERILYLTVFYKVRLNEPLRCKQIKLQSGGSKKPLLGREPWSSGYARRLTCQRSWVRIPALDSGWTWHFYTFVAKIVLFVWKKPKINEKEARDGPFFKKKHFYQNASLAWQKPISKDPIFPKRANPGLLFVYFCPY